MKIYEYLRQLKKWHLILFGVLMVYLLLANYMISFLIGENKRLDEVNLSDFKSNERTFSGIDLIWGAGNLLEDLTISGWAFSETKESNSNKSISVILKSDEKAYVIRNVPTTIRQDINMVFRKNVSIVGMQHGFSADISTFNIPDGVYEIYIYNYENSNSFGLYKTGRKFEKLGSLISEIKTSEIEVSGEFVKSDDIEFNIDSLQSENNEIIITGWGILKENPSEQYYLLLTDKDGKNIIYEVNNTSRYDIREIYGKKYTDSGIYTTIPNKGLGIGEFSVKLVIKNRNKFYLSTNSFYYNNVGDGTIEKIDKNKEYFESANTNPVKGIMDKLYYSDNLRMGVDSINNVGGYLNIEGWGALLDTNKQSSQFYIEIEDLTDGTTKMYEGLRYRRSDIVQAFRNSNLEKTGFRARFPIYDLNMYGKDSSKFKLSFYIYDNNKYYKFSENRYYELTKDFKIREGKDGYY